jgi:hypothetical protein
MDRTKIAMTVILDIMKLTKFAKKYHIVKNTEKLIQLVKQFAINVKINIF